MFDDDWSDLGLVREFDIPTPISKISGRTLAEELVRRLNVAINATDIPDELNKLLNVRIPIPRQYHTTLLPLIASDYTQSVGVESILSGITRERGNPWFIEYDTLSFHIRDATVTPTPATTTLDTDTLAEFLIDRLNILIENSDVREVVSKLINSRIRLNRRVIEGVLSCGSIGLLSLLNLALVCSEGGHIIEAVYDEWGGSLHSFELSKPRTTW